MNLAVREEVEEIPATPVESLNGRFLAVLGAALVFGTIIVWEIRKPWAKEQTWPWLMLLLAMFMAAYALRRLELWLPGEPILPHLARFHPRPLVLAGIVLVMVALALTGWMIQRLWPDIHHWQNLPLIWVSAIILIIAGTLLIGTVGRGAPRAATSTALWENSRRNQLFEAVPFLLILALAVFLRTYRLSSIPPGIYVDETNGGLDALYLLEGRPDSPFGTGWYGTPNGYLYYMAAIFKLLGVNWTSLKLVSLIPAILTVPAVYLLGRLLFGPLAGLIAMFLMAVSRWHLSMSRWGWNETAPPLFQVLSMFFLIRGLRERRALDYALSGLLMGLSIYTYLSARLAVVTTLLYLLFWVLTDPSGMQAALKRSAVGMLILFLAAFVAAAPIGVTYLKDPLAFGNRTAEISILRDIRAENSLDPLVQNIGDILKFFHQTGDLQGKHNLPGEPMTDPITGLLFAVGVAYAVIAWRDQRRFLLFLWLVLGLAGSFLSSRHESPQSYRALTALPAVVLLTADVLFRVVGAIHKSIQEQRVFPERSPAATGLVSGFLLLSLAGAGMWETNVYFGKQAASIEVLRGFNPTENRVAREVISALENDQDIYLSPRFSGYSPLRFLVYGVLKPRTGVNTLATPPYQVALPEVNLPLPDLGKDVLILLDSEYWPLRGFISAMYPQATMDLISLPDGSPLYFRIVIPQQQLAALQGLVQTISYASNDSAEEVPVASVALPADLSGIDQIIWEGAIRLEHGGEYALRGEGGLEVFLDEEPFEGQHYLGRGTYRLRVIWNAGDASDARLIWQPPGQQPQPVLEQVLFRLTGLQNGLLATYWRNMNWEGAPVFQQVTPFLLLSWPDEQPLIPNGEFSARYTGFLHVSQAGSYLLRVEADDGARLTVDGEVLAESLDAGKANELEGPLDLLPGDHPIQIDYFQQGGGSALRFYWGLNGQPLTPVPPDVLIPAQP